MWGPVGPGEPDVVWLVGVRAHRGPHGAPAGVRGFIQYDVLHRKPTTVIANASALRGLEARCSGGRVHR
eukprot:5936539-Pyramimonas_sp.AAC.1